MTFIFCPPATERLPTDYVPVGPGGNDRYYPAALPLRRLMGRYRGELRAPNVFKLTALGQSQNGGQMYTTDQPYDNPQGSIIAFTYLGSHCYPVTAEEAVLLELAGYTMNPPTGYGQGAYGYGEYGS